VVTRSFTILTTTPNTEMAELHDGETDGDHAALMRPAPDGLCACGLSTGVLAIAA
jgi:hypothetical protein